MALAFDYRASQHKNYLKDAHPKYVKIDYFIIKPSFMSVWWMTFIKAIRYLSSNMQQPTPIYAGMGFEMLSNPFGCSFSGVFVPKLDPSNSFLSSEAVINNLFTYEINESGSLSFTGIEKSMTALMMLLPLFQKDHIPFL